MASRRLKRVLTCGLIGSIALLQAFFLLVVVPGHVRGSITLDGQVKTTGVSDLVCGSCCENKSPTHDSKKPTEKDKANCAICFIKVHLANLPVLDTGVGFSGMVEILPAHIQELAGVEAVRWVYLGRAPPIFSAGC